MNFRPLSDRVLIIPDEIQEKTKSGIILTGSITKPKFNHATIAAIGRGKPINKDRCYPMFVQIGDRILYETQTANQIRIDEKDYEIIKQEKIVLIIK